MPFYKPYKTEGLNSIYNLFFCDDIELYRSTTKPDGYPWNILLADVPDIAKLEALTKDPVPEARQRLLAYRLLAKGGQAATNAELLGVIVEVPIDGGLDTLAAFKDGTARYINHIEKLVIWEVKTNESNQLIEQLFAAAQETVNQIGPWEEDRVQPPPEGNVRLTFLVSDGLYYGEGPFQVLYDDPKGGPVINAAVQLLAFLTNQQVVN